MFLLGFFLFFMIWFRKDRGSLMSFIKWGYLKLERIDIYFLSLEEVMIDREENDYFCKFIFNN